MPAGKKTLVLDSFIVLKPSTEIVFAWKDVFLNEHESEVIRLVLSRVNYFGRRESLCDAQPVEFPKQDRINAWAAQDFCETTLHGYEPVQVLCADPENALRNDQTPKTVVSMGRGKKKITKEVALYDPDWHLSAETKRLREEGWSDPPGSMWVTYCRPSDSFEENPPRARKPKQRDRGVLGARFVLDGTVLPLLQDTIFQGEILRRFVQGCYGRLFDGQTSRVFSGKDQDGMPLSGHGHTFYLPIDEDGDGRLDHVTIWCPFGLNSQEIKALYELRSLGRPGGGADLTVLLEGFLGAEDWDAHNQLPELAESRRWRSVTPFIPPRHFKRRGTKRDRCSPEQFTEIVLREEIERRGLPPPIRVSHLERCHLWDHRRKVATGRHFSWLEFRQERVMGGGRRGTHAGCGFEIEFPEPVSGPIALGYGCHFGLGLFAPS